MRCTVRRTRDGGRQKIRREFLVGARRECQSVLQYERSHSMLREPLRDRVALFIDGEHPKAPAGRDDDGSLGPIG
jgi:hypothetical protein